MPDISVLLPAYNHELYIGSAVNSLLRQQVSDIEILAVDDGSTDRTGNILDNLAQKDARLRVFHKKNEGVAAALNFALEQARGTWIASCGSDDVVPPAAYRNMLKKGRRADVVIGEFSEIDDIGRKTRVRLSFGKSCFAALFAMPSMWNKLIRRSVLLDANLKFSDVLLCEDLILLAQIAAVRPRYATLKRDVYHYRNDSTSYRSMTHCHTPEYIHAHIAGRKAVAEICAVAGMMEGFRYVYQDSLPFLADLIQHLPAGEQAELVFQEACAFLAEGGDYINEEQFRQVFIAPLDSFMHNTHRHYLQIISQVPHEEIVLRKFRSGGIGLQFALQCIRAWAAYKLDRI